MEKPRENTEVVYDSLRINYSAEYRDLKILLESNKKLELLDLTKKINIATERYKNEKEDLHQFIVDRLHKLFNETYRDLTVDNIEELLGKPCYDTVHNKLVFDANKIAKHIIEIELDKPYTMSLWSLSLIEVDD